MRSVKYFVAFLMICGNLELPDVRQQYEGYIVGNDSTYVSLVSRPGQGTWSRGAVEMSPLAY